MAVNGFDIDSFISNFGEHARAYTFMILLNNPYGTIGPDRAKYLINASSVPSSTIDPIEDNWQGNIVKTGSTTTFDDWTVTFKVDKDYQLRKDFMKWKNAVHDPITNEHGNFNDYAQDQEVWLLDTKGNIMHKINLIMAWPTSIGEISLDYSNKEKVTMDVTFAFVRTEEI